MRFQIYDSSSSTWTEHAFESFLAAKVYVSQLCSVYGENGNFERAPADRLGPDEQEGAIWYVKLANGDVAFELFFAGPTGLLNAETRARVLEAKTRALNDFADALGRYLKAERFLGSEEHEIVAYLNDAVISDATEVWEAETPNPVEITGDVADNEVNA